MARRRSLASGGHVVDRVAWRDWNSGERGGGYTILDTPCRATIFLHSTAESVFQHFFYARRLGPKRSARLGRNMAGTWNWKIRHRTSTLTARNRRSARTRRRPCGLHHVATLYDRYCTDIAETSSQTPFNLPRRESERCHAPDRIPVALAEPVAEALALAMPPIFSH